MSYKLIRHRHFRNFQFILQALGKVGTFFPILRSNRRTEAVSTISTVATTTSEIFRKRVIHNLTILLPANQCGLSIVDILLFLLKLTLDHLVVNNRSLK
jgi:hypothetical protein